MSASWPPPPDLDSIRELVAVADIEGFIADGAPADEYETEAEDVFERIHNFETHEITVAALSSVIRSVWKRSFSLDESAIDQRTSAIEGLAKQITHFFGPEAQPQVRQR